MPSRAIDFIRLPSFFVWRATLRLVLEMWWFVTASSRPI